MQIVEAKMLSLHAIVGLSLWFTSHATTSAPPELWAGHQVSRGVQRLPFRGEVETRMDALVLARVHRRGSKLVLEQESCAVTFEPVGRVQISLHGEHLPMTKFVFHAGREGAFLGHSRVAWHSEDVDGDGHPGFTVDVEAPVCDGSLYVAQLSTTKARAHLEGDSFRGEMQTRTRKEVLGARGACLSMFAPSSDETTQGPFAYAPVPEGSTCSDLLQQGWPVSAEP